MEPATKLWASHVYDRELPQECDTIHLSNIPYPNLLRVLFKFHKSRSIDNISVSDQPLALHPGSFPSFEAWLSSHLVLPWHKVQALNLSYALRKVLVFVLSDATP